MNSEALQCYQNVVDNIFIRWDALKLAVEHMGGRNGHQTAIDIKTYVYNYCTQNDNIHQSEICDILNEIMDEEFETICEDNSVNEISAHLVRYLKLCIDGNYEKIKEELSLLPVCINWLHPEFKLTLASRDDDSDSISDEDSNEEMETDEDEDGAPSLLPAEQNNRKMTENMDQDGWTTVTTKRRQK